MFSLEGNSLHDFVKFAWELGLAAGKVEGYDRHAAVVQSLASRLNATTWNWRRGCLRRIDEAGHAQGRVDWTEQCSSSMTAIYSTAALAQDEFTCVSSHSFNLQSLVEQALNQQSRTAEVIITCADRSHPKLAQHLLTWVSAMPDGTVERFELARAADKPDFSGADADVVQMITSCVFESVTPITDLRVQFVKSHSLPKRQSEVLELLLQGASIKEIASELGISPHTVKDYSRALYRHFDVCGRAELAAFFRVTESGTAIIEQSPEQTPEPILEPRAAQLIVN